ncbi:MAG TPA: DUF3108 domain-containing protein [Gammaproteobacteria bacterium]|nr:DUF3108 domain-containing protein [Gammaproteobacteria bacterium]
MNAVGTHTARVSLGLTLALVTAVSAALSPRAGEAGELKSHFPATYRVSKNGFPLGLAERRLQIRPDGTQIFTSKAHPTGLAALFVSDKVTERSVEQRQGDRIRPLSYQYRQSGGKHERQWSLHFDWAADRVTSSHDNIQHALAPDTQDLLSFQLALMLDLQAGKRSFSYPIVDKKEVHDYGFKAAGRQMLRTPVGRLKTLKLVHKDVQGEGSFIFWCAVNYGYLPVRIERTDEDGDRVTMELHSMPGKSAQYRSPDNDTLD